MGLLSREYGVLCPCIVDYHIHILCRYVWIYPYFGVVFPDSYCPRIIWSRYSDEDTFAIKNALRGTISIGVSNGIGQKRKSFEEDFVEFAEKVTGFGNIYKDHHRYSQTYFVHDLVGKKQLTVTLPLVDPPR